MLNEYKVKRKLSWVFEILQLILLAICIYSSFIVMPHLLNILEDWRPQLDQPLAVRVVAANTTEAAEEEKQLVAQKVIHTVENNFSEETLDVDIQKIVYNNLNNVDELKEIPYKMRINEQIIPPKLINGVIYPQQTHKTLLVEIREGKGDNFFCAVFPNVCLREDKEQDKEQQHEGAVDIEKTEEQQEEQDQQVEQEKIKFKWIGKIFGME